MNKRTDIDTSAILACYKDNISQALASKMQVYQNRWQQPNISADSAEVLNLLADFSTRPGKRFRGTLAWYTYQQLSNNPTSPAGQDLAVALELIQNYLLIVDDVMDRSATRRGRPTIHELYISKYKSLTNRTHLANMMAVNIGLLAQHMANDLIVNCGEDDINIKQTLNIMHHNLMATCFGQIDDLLSVYSQEMPPKTRIYSIYEAKNSYYTFINPIQMGAALAGHYNNELLQEIIKFGLPAGLAFQTQDDILGMFGNSTETGKPNLDDLREGKRTLLIYYALKMANLAEQKVIKKHLGNPQLTELDFMAVRKIIEHCGAKKRVEQEAKDAGEQAINVIQSSKLFTTEMKEFYSAIVEFAVRRKN